jgi:hypothetical protein
LTVGEPLNSASRPALAMSTVPVMLSRATIALAAVVPPK